VLLRTKNTNSPAKPGDLAVKTTPIPVNITVKGDQKTTESTKGPAFLVNTASRNRGQSTVSTLGTRKQSRRSDQPDVIETALDDIESKDTASHLEQAQNLLVSFRSIKFSDDDAEVDVSYEKSESRRLLNENIVLRRDAEMAGKFPVKAVLGSLEPFLIDIANLPDKAPPSEVRQIKDRVQRTEIVAELRSY